MEPKKRWDGYRMGIDHMAFGPDTFFGDHRSCGLHRMYATEFDTGDGVTHEWFDHVAGLENPSEFPNVIRWLVAHGYGDEQIRAVVGGNVLRALRDVRI